MGVENNDALKVYIRLPVRIEEELQIKELHPDITRVVLPRQKSRRWCFVVFPDEETRNEVVEHLKTVKINDKNIVIKPSRQRIRKPAVALSEQIIDKQ